MQISIICKFRDLARKFPHACFSSSEKNPGQNSLFLARYRAREKIRHDLRIHLIYKDRLTETFFTFKKKLIPFVMTNTYQSPILNLYRKLDREPFDGLLALELLARSGN